MMADGEATYKRLLDLEAADEAQIEKNGALLQMIARLEQRIVALETANAAQKTLNRMLTERLHALEQPAE